MAKEQNLWVLPWRFRPTGDPNDGETDEWSDNVVSNTMAWLSQVVTPSWCETPEHWTSKVMDYFFTSCPCCLFIRGVIIGWALFGLLGLGMGLLWGWLLTS